MGERAKITAKTPEAKRKHTISRKQKTTHSQSMNSPADRILHLQRTIGNQAVQRMMKSGTLQAKLRIGQLNDKYEQEADRVADQVMRMPEPQVQRQEEEEEEEIQTKPLADQITPLIQRQVDEEEEEEPIQTKGLTTQITPLVQRQTEPEKEEEEEEKLAQPKLESHTEYPVQRQAEEEEEEEEEPVQAKLITPDNAKIQKQEEPEEEEETVQTQKISGHSSEANPKMSSNIKTLQGSSGQPLPKAVKDFFEPRFNRNFNHVRVHTDALAAKSAQTINTSAYTIGRDIVFGAGQYAPETTKGKKLLAHELTHTLQQCNNGGVARGPLKISPSNDKSEPEADRVVDNITCESGVNVQLALSAPVIQRACPPPERLGRIPEPEPCTRADPNTRAPDPFGLPLRFCVDSDNLIDSDAGYIAELRSHLGILTLAAGRSVHIHGYASLPGGRRYNRRLACHRAIAVKNMLGLRTMNPIILYSHGETSIFGPQAENQRVVVSIHPPPTRPLPSLTTPTSPTPSVARPTVILPTHIRGTASPAGMPDRIPPRVNTAVRVGISGWRIPMLPVTLSIDGGGGGNGAATINGAATANLTGSATVQLRGVYLNQTLPGRRGNLRLLAHQGGTRLAASNGFSVSSIPQNMTIAFVRLVPGAERGIVVRHTWNSDSNDIVDLDKTDVSERVEIIDRGGSLASLPHRTSGYLGTGTTALDDKHAIPALRSAGFEIVNQIEMFKDNRTGAVDIPMTNSGFRIGKFIIPKPGTGFLGFFMDYEVTTRKYGRPVTARGMRSNAGKGQVIRTQNV